MLVAPGLLLLGLGLSFVEAEEVVTLTTAGFEKHLKDNKQTLVEFYAPWCGHCKKLEPEFEKAAVQLKDRGVVLGKVDATAEKEIASKYDVKGFPTLWWFEDGEKMEYDGGRTTETIVSWIQSMTGPAVTEASEPGQPGEVPVIVLYAKSKNNGFEEAAKAARRKATWFFVSTDAPAKVTILHKSEEPIDFHEGFDDKTKVLAMLENNALPIWGKLDGASYDKYIQSGKGLIWTLFNHPAGEADKVAEENRKMMSDVAKKFKGTYHFTYTDTVEFKGAVENMLGISEYPAVAVQKKAGDKKKYIYRGEIEGNRVSQFVSDVVAGKVEAHLKSEPVPQPNDEPVRVIVGNTMQELFDKQRDVMLEIYAPWCGHCKKLDPEYNKLAQKVKKEELTDLLLIAKMDGTTNDSPYESIEWSGFPTMYYIKAGSDKADLYDGERTAKGLWRYIKKHATKADEIKERIARRKSQAKKGDEL